MSTKNSNLFFFGGGGGGGGEGGGCGDVGEEGASSVRKYAFRIYDHIFIYKISSS